MDEIKNLFDFLNLYGDKQDRLDNESRKNQQTLREIMLLVAAKKKIPKAVLESFAEAVKTVSNEMELKLAGDRLYWDWRKAAFTKLHSSAKFIRIAEDILLNRELSRIKHCEGENCPFIFFDESKNKSRKWCEMSHCGMLLKSKRYYEKHRKRNG